MGAKIRRTENGIWEIRIAGVLAKKEMDAVQATGLTGGLDSEGNARVLVIIDPDFLGWAGTEVWNDMSFFVEYGDRIARMAIVGDVKWKDRMLMFTGAGFRCAEVRYFADNALTEAKNWLNDK